MGVEDHSGKYDRGIVDAHGMLTCALGSVSGIGRKRFRFEIIRETLGKPVQQIPGITIDGQAIHDLFLDGLWKVTGFKKRARLGTLQTYGQDISLFTDDSMPFLGYWQLPAS